MLVYWPGAICDKGVEMFTYGACDTKEKAIKCIENWNKDFHVLEAWIDVCDLDKQTQKKLKVGFAILNEEVM